MPDYTYLFLGCSKTKLNKIKKRKMLPEGTELSESRHIAKLLSGSDATKPQIEYLILDESAVRYNGLCYVTVRPLTLKNEVWE